MERVKGDIISPHIRLHRPDFRNVLDVYIKAEIVGLKQSYAKSLTFEDVPDNVLVLPCMSLDAEGAQRLMDDLWHCGVRPTEGTGSAGSLKATQNHLADLKKILFHKLGIDKEIQK
jgi:hypothetical protein